MSDDLDGYFSDADSYFSEISGGIVAAPVKMATAQPRQAVPVAAATKTVSTSRSTPFLRLPATSSVTPVPDFDPPPPRTARPVGPTPVDVVLTSDVPPDAVPVGGSLFPSDSAPLVPPGGRSASGGGGGAPAIVGGGILAVLLAWMFLGTEKKPLAEADTEAA